MKKILWLLCCCWHVVLATETTIQFRSDVPLLSPEQMNPRFWQTKLAAPQQLLLTPAQIAQRNSETFALQSEMQSLQSLPAHYSKAELGAIIQSVSKVPTAARFYLDGSQLTAQHWQHYQSLTALDHMQAVNPLRFGLVVKRSALRAFPTRDRIVNEQGNPDLDRFAETALFPADAVALLHSSRDNQWLLVRSFNYTGWLQAADVAIGSKQQVLAYTQQQPFIVITGAKVHTAFNPQLAAVSELQLDMGVRLPLLSAAEAGFNVHGQNPVASHIVQLPLRLADGSLSFTPALLPLSADVQQGYLPFTPYNILAQAFKFLGERYGWGHDYNGRDCTGFISEIFRSFGLLMPRNSGQQGNGGYGRNIRFSADSSVADKQAALAKLQVGDLLYFPGHVALYLGTVNGQPFMIHDVNTLLYPRSDGTIYRGTLNGVAVTPLLPLYATEQQSYFDAMYAIKSLR
ncbi:SH3 domain-containing protein [Rheinheimera sp. YQF-2]|uniref:SH3 domain-containing protein n=2 Tax=Rheinheimera lutimaris TaxID=2740584 RepID=A0A7Y5EIX1_9GAMM|nr:SH3 domain-containing protein [Rheinheimera lutimaris]